MIPLSPELRALDLPAEQLVPTGWHDTLVATRVALEQHVMQKQNAIATQARRQHEQFVPGQLVLVKRTPHELQQSHTKLTDKFDHISRVVSALPSGVIYQIPVPWRR